VRAFGNVASFAAAHVSLRKIKPRSSGGDFEAITTTSFTNGPARGSDESSNSLNEVRRI
jgi:hypothetical protein